jgi:hypothetical protein
MKSEYKTTQNKLKVFTATSLTALSLTTTCLPLVVEAKTPTKKPKGFVHDTAGDGNPAVGATINYDANKTPKWVQYDWGGLYWYNHGDIGKARSYWLEAKRGAEIAVVAERRRGLSTTTANQCCELIKHLMLFVTDTKFKPGMDSSTYGFVNYLGKKTSTDGSPQARLADAKTALREMMKDWEWWETIGNFADRTIGKQRDCMRTICDARSVFERKIVTYRQNAQRIEEQTGVPYEHTTIDFSPLVWGGVPGAGNPFNRPDSNPLPVAARGGADLTRLHP